MVWATSSPFFDYVPSFPTWASRRCTAGTIFPSYWTVKLAESALSWVSYGWSDKVQLLVLFSKSVTLTFTTSTQVVQDVYLLECHADVIHLWIRSYIKGIKVPWGVQTVQMRCISSKHGCAACARWKIVNKGKICSHTSLNPAQTALMSSNQTLPDVDGSQEPSSDLTCSLLFKFILTNDEDHVKMRSSRGRCRVSNS